MEIFTTVVVWPTTGRRVIRYTSYNRTGGILSNRYIPQSRIFGVTRVSSVLCGKRGGRAG